MNRNTNSRGFAHIILVVVVVVILGALGVAGWKAYQAKHAATANDSVQNSQAQSAAADPYKDWQVYDSSKAGYSVKYPKGWSYEEGEPTAAFAAVSFTPEVKTSGVITVSSFRSDLEPKAFVEKNSVNLSVIKSSTDSINGYDTYYYVSGDGTYVNRSYVIAHDGVITTISMTEKADAPPTDNSIYVNQFDLLAKSLNIKTGRESANTNVMQIKELGISIVVPGSMKDLTYAYYPAEGSPRLNAKYDNRIVGYVNFSTRSLTAADPECAPEKANPLGGATKITGTYKDGLFAGGAWSGGSIVKQFDDSFLTYVGPQYACQDPKSNFKFIADFNAVANALKNAKEL